MEKIDTIIKSNKGIVLKKVKVSINEESYKILASLAKMKNISLPEAVRKCIAYYQKNQDQ